MKLGDSYFESLLITKELVDEFSEISGDKNPLHVDESFGARSVYRQRIVHGMLSILTLLKIDIFTRNTFFLKYIKANFIKPIFIDEELEVTCVISAVDVAKESYIFDFTIRKLSRKILVVKGKFEILLKNDSELKQQNYKDHISTDLCLIKSLIQPQKIRFEDLAEGLEETFEFNMNQYNLTKMLSIIGLLNDRTPFLDSYKNFNNFFALSVLSTFVGMRIPGLDATFVDFEVGFTEPCLLENLYDFNGIVTLKSEATRGIMIAIKIIDKKRNLQIGTGRLTAKINNETKIMPKFKEILTSKKKFSFSEKVVLVTGSSRGIGEVILKNFAAYDAKVVINYLHSQTEAENIYNELRNENIDCLITQCNVSDITQVDQMIEKIITNYGKIDIVVNNAVGDFIPLPFDELSWEDCLKELNITLKGAFNCCKSVLPLMAKQRYGKIINISSTATEYPPARQSKYVIAKSALDGLTRSLAIDYARYNIQINSVVPSFIETDLTNAISPNYVEKIKESVPMNRLASACEIADVVLFLASEYSNYITGQRIVVNGGGFPLL